MLSWISFLKTRTKPVYLINPPCVKLNRMTINIRLEIQSICGQNCWFQIKSPSGLNLISLQNNASSKTEKERNEITILFKERNCQRWSIFYFTTFFLFAAGSKRWAWWGVNRNQGLLDRGSAPPSLQLQTTTTTTTKYGMVGSGRGAVRSVLTALTAEKFQPGENIFPVNTVLR